MAPVLYPQRERSVSPSGQSEVGFDTRKMVFGPARAKKRFVLCFDGTGNKFSGTDGDSNILKIYRMLDRKDPAQFHYYQPGIGTYVTSNSLSNDDTITARIKSYFEKIMDSAVGTSFDQHVMAGYRFLMRFYSEGDEIYFFGFSRGAYIARFLAEMLDYIGLLSAGNEELLLFAWKTFAQWQQRHGLTQEEREKKVNLFNYMTAFRETFSRPVRRIRFLGLFDTVNSVPRFESAWMKRSKFPYTAKSSAKVIRHAVSIDERRAKFRQDLISEDKARRRSHHHHHHVFSGLYVTEPTPEAALAATTATATAPGVPEVVIDSPSTPIPRLPISPDTEEEVVEQFFPQFRSSSPEFLLYADNNKNGDTNGNNEIPIQKRNPSLAVPLDYPSDVESVRSGASSARSHACCTNRDRCQHHGPRFGRRLHDQDIQEVWFAGGHADVGAGWPLEDGVAYPLSHIPLTWMVAEARKTGLSFDETQMELLGCLCDPAPKFNNEAEIEIGTEIELGSETDAGDMEHPLHLAISAPLHDSLAFTPVQSILTTLVWRLMEYLPIQRMDLQSDGTWRPIRWPLPKGEVRDIPHDALVHGTVIRRMCMNKSYRPGNLIVGGGGRGVRTAPKEFGIGKWVVVADAGGIGEVWKRK